MSSSKFLHVAISGAGCQPLLSKLDGIVHPRCWSDWSWISFPADWESRLEAQTVCLTGMLS